MWDQVIIIVTQPKSSDPPIPRSPPLSSPSKAINDDGSLVAKKPTSAKMLTA